ncbi:MAG: hypothetical protein KGJ90_00060 [Patescibacteria group bacterium]|nr:hypothetical protein [Patescibacteria group bacterium]
MAIATAEQHRREAAANARLIAAAPDLLESLEQLSGAFQAMACTGNINASTEEWTALNKWCDKADAAIDKAKGE